MSRLRTPHPAVQVAVHAVVYLTALTMLIPFLWMVLTSLKTDEAAAATVDLTRLFAEGPSNLFPDVWVWENYLRAFSEGNLARFYFNSIVVAVVTTVLAVAHNALAGYAFSKMRFAGKRILFGATLMTMMLPAQCFFIFALVIAASLGLVNNLQAMIVPFLASGFGVFYMRQAISSVPDSLLEAGRLDGMTDLDLFWSIVRPATWPAISALAIFTFVNSWNNFFWPLIVVDDERYKTLPLAIADLQAGLYVQSWPVTMAATTILVGPLILVFFVLQRSFVRGVTLTGMKE